MREVMLGVGSGLAAAALVAWFAWYRLPVRRMNAWLGDLESELRAYNEVCLAKAACEIRLRQVVDRLPQEFEFPVFAAMRMGAAAEAFVREEAVRRGLMPDDGLKPKLDEKPKVAASADRDSGPMTVWDESGRQRPRLLS